MKIPLAFLSELFNLPALFRNLFHHGELIVILTKRDFMSRFRGSLGGIFWSILQPFFMVLIYTLVFSGFLKVKFGASGSPYTFAVYLLCGLLPWAAFSESLNQSTAIIRSNFNLVKRVIFPLEVLPFSFVLVNLIQQVIGFTLLVPLAWWVTGSLNWEIILVPLILVYQAMLYIGISWIWSSLSVYFVDLKQLTPLLLTVGMFLTPLFYPEELVPYWAVPVVITLNPIAHLVSMYRSVVLMSVLPGAVDLIVVGLFCLATFMVGYFWFMHTKKGFADIL